jgi:hypothetical protein
VAADFSHQMRKFIRKSVRISIKIVKMAYASADFRTKCASSWKKRSKTVENCRKMYETLRQAQGKLFENCIETFENIGKYSTIFYPPAHLIEISVGHEKA